MVRRVLKHKVGGAISEGIQVEAKLPKGKKRNVRIIEILLDCGKNLKTHNRSSTIKKQNIKQLTEQVHGY